MKFKASATALAAATAVFALGISDASASANAKDKIDSGLFAAFSPSDDGTSISMLVCGRLPDSSGCYGSGGMSGFGHACAVLEGDPKYKAIENGERVTRAIYVLDKRASKSAPAILYVYTRTDTITNDASDSVSLTLDTQVTLTFNGGGQRAKCTMAANLVGVYAGTDIGGASSIDKKTLSIQPLAGPGLLSITADERGFIAVNTPGQNEILDPNGNGIQDGGGNYYMINDRNGWQLP